MRLLRVLTAWPPFGVDRATTAEALDILQFLDGLFAPGSALATAFPGGVHFDRNEPGARTRPYVTIDLLSEVPSFDTAGLVAESVTVQFAIACDSVPEGRRLRRTLIKHPTEGLDFVGDVDLGAGDLVVTATRTGGAAVLDPDPNPDCGEAVLVTVDYVFLCSRN